MAEEKTLEDYSSFLTQLKEECPEILSILTSKQVDLISLSPNEPYIEGKVDEGYLSDEGAYRHTKSMWKDAKENLNEYLLKPWDSSKQLTAQDVVAFEKKRNALNMVIKLQNV